jgi:hypothetical protein
MAKQKNPNIGMVECLEGCGNIAAVRQDRNRKFYTDCPNCGRLPAGHAPRQEKILNTATIWGDAGTPPPACPVWIAESWPWGRALSDRAGLAPQGGGESLTTSPEVAPVKKSPGIKPPPAPPKPKAAPEATPEATPEAAPEPSGFSFLD